MAFHSNAADKIRRKKAALHALAGNFAENMESHAKQTAEWTDRTSHARQSIHAGVEQDGDKTIVYLSHGVPYGEYLEEGTPPHVIRPKNAKALYWHGAAHPVKKVNHPGTEGYPVIGPTVDLFWPRMRNARRQLFREE